MAPGNLLTPLPDASAEEQFADVLTRPGCRIERIVSQGQTTPADRPYGQSHDEWVLVLAGAARIETTAGETALSPGDHMLIPAGVAHRVTFTDPDQPTVWLAVHFEAERSETSSRAAP
ncbi:cupin domain-containing protein [Methylopila sp. 73B]|uniref:cupin domain-containing protein n=1 Tax=Methylopila sp. 73B TaxID=1120792 RepID=UPI00035DE64F|nr:cupin domain-containing protein [Methylopila sp. 73B]